MKRPELFLHPGMHKTGTTAIQESLDQNRDWLREHGVAYPKLSFPEKKPRKAHHDLFEALALDGPEIEKELQHYCSQIEQSAEGARLTVLSAEPIYRLAYKQNFKDRSGEAFLVAHRSYLERVRHFLDAFDVSVLIYFRRPDSFAVSHFKNSIANGGVPSCLAEHAKRISRFFNYQSRLKLYGEIFEHVETRCYEAEAESGLVAGFYGALGSEEPPATRATKVRISHGNRATLWLRRARVEDESRKRHRYRLQFAADSRVDALFAEPEPSTLWPSDAAFCEFVERNRSSYEDSFYALPEPPGRPTTTWSDEMHAKAQEAFELWLRANERRLELRDKAGLKKYWDPDPAASAEPPPA